MKYLLIFSFLAIFGSSVNAQGPGHEGRKVSFQNPPAKVGDTVKQNVFVVVEDGTTHTAVEELVYDTGKNWKAVFYTIDKWAGTNKSFKVAAKNEYIIKVVDSR
jgi:hypothetical protein